MDEKTKPQFVVPTVSAFTVQGALDYVSACGSQYADARYDEMILEARRHVEKSRAIERIMKLSDPQKDNKPYSATAAEKVVELDAAYAAYLEKMAEAARRTILSHSQWISAQLIAKSVIGGQKLDAGKQGNVQVDVVVRHIAERGSFLDRHAQEQK